MMTGFEGNGAQYVVMRDTLREFMAHPITAEDITHGSVLFGRFQIPDGSFVSTAFLRTLFVRTGNPVYINVSEDGKRSLKLLTARFGTVNMLVDSLELSNRKEAMGEYSDDR